jgi:hypothetical protein
MTTTLAARAATATAAADLLLARMAFANPSPKKIRTDVGKLLEAELTIAEFNELRNELASSGFLTKGKRNMFALSDAGRQRALRFLGIEQIPARGSWSALVAKDLFPMAAGISEHAASKLDSGDKLAAFVLKRKYGLAAGAGSTVNQVLEAVVCKELGFAEETTLEGLLRAVLSKLVRSERLTKQQLVKQLPLFQTGLKAATADVVRSKIVRDWLGGAPSPERAASAQSHEPFDLPAFAATVRALAAASTPEDRFHDNKVFIAALWRTSQREPNFPRLSLAEFKQRLVEANSQNLLHLSRADLVQAMEPQLVADSETPYLNATFHFVVVERTGT